MLEYIFIWMILNATPLDSFHDEYELIWKYQRDNFPQR